MINNKHLHETPKMTAIRIIDILLVEDNPKGIKLTKEVRTEEKIKNMLRVVNEGEKAIN